MKPLNYFEQITKMPNKADKFDLRLRMVKSAIANETRPTARLFATTPATVRKWLGRYQQERLASRFDQAVTTTQKALTLALAAKIDKLNQFRWVQITKYKQKYQNQAMT